LKGHPSNTPFVDRNCSGVSIIIRIYPNVPVGGQLFGRPVHHTFGV
jgi:hypothetical protein